MKRLKLKIGIPLSLFIGMMSAFPRLIRFEINGAGELLHSIFYHFVFAFLCWLISQYSIRYRHRYPLFFITATAVSACIILSMFYYLLAASLSLQLPWIQNIYSPQRLVILMVRGGLIGGFQFFISYYIHLLQEAQNSKIENEKLKQENLMTRLEMLKQQMTPHFLFNALNTITTLTKEESTKEYTIRLAHVYRHLLQYNENNLTSVRDELQFIDSYIYVQQTRFESALQVYINVDEKTASYTIPTLTLQVLIENAIKHNIATVQRPLHIHIANEGTGYLVVRNSLQPKKSIEESTKKGLQNINDRYKLLSEKQIHIDRTDDSFIVKIPLLAP